MGHCIVCANPQKNEWHGGRGLCGQISLILGGGGGVGQDFANPWMWGWHQDLTNENSTASNFIFSKWMLKSVLMPP